MALVIRCPSVNKMEMNRPDRTVVGGICFLCKERVLPPRLRIFPKAWIAIRTSSSVSSKDPIELRLLDISIADSLAN